MRESPVPQADVAERPDSILRAIQDQASGDDPWRRHHLAILYHSAAYDLEAEGSDEAFDHWAKALGQWSLIYHDEWFWKGMHRQLVETMDVAVDFEIVQAVRRQLPQDLLAPHVSLAGRYRLTDPARARVHVRLIESAPFPAEFVTAARDSVIGAVLTEVEAADKDRPPPELIDTLATYLRIDPTNPRLVRAVLWVCRKSLEQLWYWPDQPVLDQIGERLDQATELALPVLVKPPAAGDQAMAIELARYEFWLGKLNLGRAYHAHHNWSKLIDLDRTLVRAGEAVQHFDRAVELDDALATDVAYKNIGEYHLWAAKLIGWSIMGRKRDSTPAEWQAAARCLQRAMDRYPPDGDAGSLLDELIDGPDQDRAAQMFGDEPEYQPGLEYWLGCAALREAKDLGSRGTDAECRAAARRAIRQFQRTIKREPRILRQDDHPDVRRLLAQAERIIEPRRAKPAGVRPSGAEAAPDPIRRMRRAGRLAAQLLEATARQIRVGISTEELDRFASALMVSLGVRSSYRGYETFPMTISTSVNDVICRGIPNGNPLRDGDIVSIAVGIAVDGVHTATTRTFPVGDVDEESARLIEHTAETMHRAIDVIWPGRQVGVIGRAIESCARQLGYGVVRDIPGHGIGAEPVIEPIVPSHDDPGATSLLEPGLTFTIHPMLTLGGDDCTVGARGWTVRTKDRRRSAECQHTVVVTRTGAEILTVP
jgi:methionyl aminopeptidase